MENVLEMTLPVDAIAPAKDPHQKLVSANGGLCLNTIPSLRKSVRKITLRAEGKFTVRYTAATCKVVMELLLEFDQLVLDLRAVTEYDLAAIQLLNMLCRCKEVSGKKITIEPGLKPADYDLFVASGLAEIITSKNLK